MEYPVWVYGRMIADRIRMDSYEAALERVVAPGSVVVDIGTGTGIAALVAARLGARRVFAIDPSPVISLARQAAADNGYADRIELFEASALTVELPEPADVVVADLRSVLPYHTVNLRVLEDARRRFLKPTGALIPRKDILWGAPAAAPKHRIETLDVWRTHSRGFDLEPARTLVANEFVKVSLEPDALLSEAKRFGSLDYESGESRDLTASTSFTVTRDGAIDGICLWFDTVLVDDIGFSNAPGAHPDSVYGQAFFPITEQVAVSRGDEIGVDLATNLVANDYVYRWSVRVGPKEKPRATFRQSSFAAQPLSSQILRSAGHSHAPSLNSEGELTRRALELMDGKRTLADIAAALEDEVGSHAEALAVATRLSLKYSRS